MTEKPLAEEINHLLNELESRDKSKRALAASKLGKVTESQEEVIAALQRMIERERDDFVKEVAKAAVQSLSGVKETSDAPRRADPPAGHFAATSPAPARYPALRTIAGFYRVLAFVAGGFAVISALLTLGSSLLVALGALVIGAVLTVSLLAVAEGIQVLIDIEANTRQAANRDR